MSKLVFYTCFNARRSQREKFMSEVRRGRPHPVETDAWTEHRANLWKTFTLPSILRQSHDDFIYVVFLDPKLREKTDRYLPKVDDPRVVFSFDGKAVLEAIAEHGEIVAVRIDSDDMYARDAGAIFMACPDPWMYFRHGYIYHAARNDLLHYDTLGTGPFHAHRLTVDDFTLPEDRDLTFKEIYRTIAPGHSRVVDHHPTQLANGQFCVQLHRQNTSSSMQMRNVGRAIRNPNLLPDAFGYTPSIRKAR